MLGDLAEPGVSPPRSEVAKPCSTGESDFLRKMRSAALGQVAKGWQKGPLRYTARAEHIVGGRETIVNAAYRLGAQQSDKRRAADDLKGSLTDESQAVFTPIKLPL